MAADFDEDDWNRAVEDLDEDHQRIDAAPTSSQQLGRFTVMALILNRTIGSGIFVTPVKVLNGTGSTGASLLLWFFGAIVATSGLLVWLELGLSIPMRIVQVMPGIFERTSVPRSGGEKNYLEFIYSNPITGEPKFLITCLYGIAFILLGNLSGNAIAFGTYVMEAAGQPDPAKGTVIGIAIAVLTAAVGIHVFSRRGGILLNNIFAIIKVLILVTIIVLGFTKAAGHNLGGPGTNSGGPTTNAVAGLSPKNAFSTSRGDLASYTDSFLYIVYSYSGFEQPFYVLSEVARPRKVFPKYTLIAMLIASTLFVLVNLAYLCVIPKDFPGLADENDMATVFFGQVFGDEGAKKVMSAVIAFSILGNIVVMTFTAARVKQEIAKEGILPYSLFFATGHTTSFARLKDRFFPSRKLDSDHLEQTPMAALGLHWFTSILLIAVTSMMNTTTTYSALVNLYSYSIIILNGFLCSGGLLLLKLMPSRNWATEANIKFWIDPIHAIIYCLTCAFLLVTAFIKPADDSPYSYKNNKIQWFVIPVIGLSTLLWGLVWYGGLHLVMYRRMKELVVTRIALVVPDNKVEGQFIQKAEIIRHEWHTRIPSTGPSLDYDHEMS
ncbi:amino acid permease-domain-containing protein [Amylocarpus encephaloides]|uniref:Amino acid permease-domain-containing protein n=1 Tax=Amylocarpus encephaloides TaxID=45428 RepID=A0A9P7YGW5_9HELO|nr:amino acid permease-domain-containing protein [Amylocarpus encephaloides]